jgi:hypothetical protein
LPGNTYGISVPGATAASIGWLQNALTSQWNGQPMSTTNIQIETQAMSFVAKTQGVSASVFRGRPAALLPCVGFKADCQPHKGK